MVRSARGSEPPRTGKAAARRGGLRYTPSDKARYDRLVALAVRTGCVKRLS